MPDLTPRYLDGQQFDVEDQGGVRWNHAAGAARAVAQIGRDDQLAAAAHFHALYAFVPATEHHAGAQGEFERIIAVVAGIEFRAFAAVVVLQPAGVVHGDVLASFGFGAFAHAQFDVLQAGAGGNVAHIIPSGVR